MAQYAPRVDSVTLPKLRAVFRAVPATSGAAEFGGDRHEDGRWEFSAEFDAVFKQFDRRREHALMLGGFLCARANKRGQRRISERSRMRGVKGESGGCHRSSAGKGRLNGAFTEQIPRQILQQTLQQTPTVHAYCRSKSRIVIVTN